MLRYCSGEEEAYMSQKDEISIMGCGWLGLPLAAQLVKAGYNVKGSTTTPEKLEVLQAE